MDNDMASLTELLRRLQEHSGLPESGATIPTDTLAEFLHLVTRNGSSLHLSEITSDIVGCLDQLNRHVNRSPSREKIWQEISRSVVYSVSGIVGGCLEKAIELQNRDLHSEVARDLLRSAWQIQCAWDGFLSGDIDDLVQHVSLESNARSFVQ
jgi:hypothetical protein